ncbi:MAG: rubrerythrin family protein [Chloroflexia bacterium]|nr:rubrerythrin family protein [Chloroflexia bacterium]
MHKMTKANLEAAFAGESQAHMRYQIFADMAEKEGMPNIARLFRAISQAELVHARSHLRVLGGVGSTPENLVEAIGGETYEVDEMYPAFVAVARLQEEKQATRSMGYALEVEKIHAAMYQEAKQSADAGQDLALGTIHVCDVCGYTVEGEAPDRCPVCNAIRDRFRAF